MLAKTLWCIGNQTNIMAKQEGLSRFKKIDGETWELYKQFSKKKDAKQYAEMLRRNGTRARVIVDIGGYIVYRLA